MGMTPQHIYTIPTSCAILPTMHNRKLSTHSLNEHGTQNCSLHSLPYERQSIPDSATSATIKFHNSQYTIAQHCSQFLHTRQDYIYLPCSTATTLVTKYILYSNQMLYKKKLTFRLLILRSSPEHHNSVLYMLCML